MVEKTGVFAFSIVGGVGSNSVPGGIPFLTGFLRLLFFFTGVRGWKTKNPFAPCLDSSFFVVAFPHLSPKLNLPPKRLGKIDTPSKDNWLFTRVFLLECPPFLAEGFPVFFSCRTSSLDVPPAAEGRLAVLL